MAYIASEVKGSHLTRPLRPYEPTSPPSERPQPHRNHPAYCIQEVYPSVSDAVVHGSRSKYNANLFTLTVHVVIDSALLRHNCKPEISTSSPGTRPTATTISRPEGESAGAASGSRLPTVHARRTLMALTSTITRYDARTRSCASWNWRRAIPAASASTSPAKRVHRRGDGRPARSGLASPQHEASTCVPDAPQVASPPASRYRRNNYKAAPIGHIHDIWKSVRRDIGCATHSSPPADMYPAVKPDKLKFCIPLTRSHRRMHLHSASA